MSVVYFAQVGEDGPIKIGFTRDLPETRIQQMQIGCPWRIRLLGSREGTVFQEQRFQSKFSSVRMVGEWFEPTPDLVAAVAHALSTVFTWPEADPVAPPMGAPGASFLAEIEEFLALSGMTVTAFGVSALNDPKFVPDIRRKGRSPSLKTVDKVRAFMRGRERSAA